MISILWKVTSAQTLSKVHRYSRIKPILVGTTTSWSFVMAKLVALVNLVTRDRIISDADLQ